MSETAQNRFKRLFPNRPKPDAVTNGQSRAERELAEQEERRHSKPEPQVTASSGKQTGDTQGSATSTTKSNQCNGHRQQTSGLNAEAAEFIPSGLAKGGISWSALQKSDDNDYHKEPLSSNTDLVGTFCLFSLVQKFPYKYLRNPPNGLSEAFFAAEKVYERKWTMHYLMDPKTSKLLIFVPIQEVHQLVADINAKFRNLKTNVPPYPFQISFYKSAPCPVLLGTVNSKADLVRLQELLPDTLSGASGISANATNEQKFDYAVWEEKIERAVEAQKGKGNKSRYKEQKRLMRIADDSRALSRTQQYLGFTPESGSATDELIDITKPAPYPVKDEPVFVSIDVESWERDHNMITEIGISTIDSLALTGLSPELWHTKIRSRHFRIKGREHIVNHEFVSGHPDRFQFGASELVSIEAAPKVVDNCFVYPFSAGYETGGLIRDENGPFLPKAPEALSIDPVEAQKKRNVILVGHSIQGDIQYLANLGCDLINQRSPLHPHETLDTNILYRSYRKSNNHSTSLANVCQDLDIDTFFLHNAGNDARYTLEAFLKIAMLAKPEKVVPRVVQEAPPLFADRETNGDDETITFEEANRRYLEANGIVDTISAREESISNWDEDEPPY